MINYYAFFYMFLGISLNTFFNIYQMLAINLTIIAITRGVYILGYYLTYIKSTDLADPSNSKYTFSKREKIYFEIKNGVVIFSGFMNIYLAIFLGLYSLMIAAVYIRRIGKDSSKKKFKQLGWLLYYLSPILFTIFVFLDITTIIPVALALILFLIRGQTYSNYSIERLFQRYEKRIFRSKINVERRYRNLLWRKSIKGLRLFIMGYLVIGSALFGISILLFGSPQKTKNVYITMSDGKRLATNVFHPPLLGESSGPVILIRTPYGKDTIGMDYYASLYLSQGYHVVFQDIRNTYASEGDKTDLLFAMSYKDGVDTIKWILDQSWCNGKIGSVGVSALAINQYFYAGMKDAYNGEKGLKVQSLWFGTPDLYLDAIMEGAFHQNTVIDWTISTAPTNYRYQHDTIYHLIDTQDTSNAAYQATTLNAGENIWKNVNCSALHVGGWYDVFLGGTLRGYKGYDDLAGENARGRQALILGPWTHGMVFTGEQGELTYPATSSGIFLILDWEQKIVDDAFYGTQCNLWDGNRVAYYLMGDVDDPSVEANYWKYTNDWPLNYSWNLWYFGIAQNGDYIVVDDANDLDGVQGAAYSYDPRDPCPTIGGTNLGYSPGPRDQRSIESREDVLVFTSDTLDEPYTIEGDLKVKLHFKSNCTDTDFNVKLCDVYPDGRSMLIMDGAKMARLRNNVFQQELLTPDQEYTIEIDLLATAYQFNSGHKIRILVTSSNHPRYAINPNTGGSLTDHYSKGFIASNTIITGPEKSCIYLPELNN